MEYDLRRDLHQEVDGDQPPPKQYNADTYEKNLLGIFGELFECLDVGWHIFRRQVSNGQRRW